jgi:carbamoyltransferase
MDIAASIQAVTEDIILRIGYTAYRLTNAKNLVMAGGVALNCAANGRLLREGPFESIWVQPAAGDAGGALGAALFHWYQTLGKPRECGVRDKQNASLLGPSFNSTEVREILDGIGAVYEYLSEDSDLFERIAGYLAEEKTVGWFQGRMEFGPRALGSRSILGDPRSPKMQAMMNLKVKYRESYRPFAPAILEEHAGDWFDMGSIQGSPYMLFVFSVLEKRRLQISEECVQIMKHDPNLQSRLSVLRSTVPSVTHVDFSARVQTVKLTDSPRFHSLLSAFHRRTGCPLLINTSFNVRGEPIVCTPLDAYRCFIATNIDVLVIENCVLKREDLSSSELVQANEYLRAIEPD